MLLSSYKVISFALFAAGLVLLAYAVFFAWKNRLSRMYRDVKSIESALPVEEAGREVFSAIRAEDLRRYRENNDTGTTDVRPRHSRMTHAEENEKTHDVAESAAFSGFTDLTETETPSANNHNDGKPLFVSLNEEPEEEATSYIEESGEDEATSYIEEPGEDEATSYLEESGEDEATEESGEDEATSYIEASGEDEATSYLEEPVEDEATTYLEEPAESVEKEKHSRKETMPHTPDIERESRADDSDGSSDDNSDDSDATSYLADPSSREYREEVMNAIYRCETSTEKKKNKSSKKPVRSEGHSASSRREESGKGEATSYKEELAEPIEKDKRSRKEAMPHTPDVEKESNSDNSDDSSDDSDATTYLADPSSREYREDVMDAIYRFETSTGRGKSKGKQKPVRPGEHSSPSQCKKS
jgi:hypothetical protein